MPNVLLMNAYSSVFFYDVVRGLSRHFEDNSLFRATFSVNSDHIIAISRQPKINKYKLIVLNVKSNKDEILESLDLQQDTFPNFGNFYPCNIYQCEINITLIAGVDLEPGKKEIGLNCPHSLYILKGDLLSKNLQIKKMRLFSCLGYSDFFLESSFSLPTYKFLYIENRCILIKFLIF